MKKHVFQQQLVGMTWRWMVQITEQQKNTLQDFELTKGIGNTTQQQQYRVTKPATKQKNTNILLVHTEKQTGKYARKS